MATKLFYARCPLPLSPCFRTMHQSSDAVKGCTLRCRKSPDRCRPHIRPCRPVKMLPQRHQWSSSVKATSKRATAPLKNRLLETLALASRCDDGLACRSRPQSGTPIRVELPMIVNLCYDKYCDVNIAESFTQPIDYFDFGEPTEKRPFSMSLPKNVKTPLSMIVAGGSGLLRNAWYALRAIVDESCGRLPIVIWGMGINDHGRFDKNYNETLAYIENKKNILIGLRDSFYSNYVPCASCMMSELDAGFKIQREVGFYAHHSFDVPHVYPVMSNRVHGDRTTYLWRVLQFLGSCDIVVTNTYHGAYWATLLNRKVIVVRPFSNKFLGFKYEPIIIRDISSLMPAMKIARSYPLALAESRKANQLFFERVVEFRQEFGYGSH